MAIKEETTKKHLRNEFVRLSKDERLYNLELPIVAITGGIATGKSSVTKILKDNSLEVICADELVKNVYAKKESIEFISKNFPEAISEKNIDFKKLREILFDDEVKLKTVESFIYSHLPEEFLKAASQVKGQDFIFYDVPLLFEKGLDSLVDVRVCVYSKRETQRERLANRDQINSELIEQMLSKQIDIEEKKKKADVIIFNESDLDRLRLETIGFVQKLLF